MKTSLNILFKTKTLALLIVFVTFSYTAKSAEFLVADQEVTWGISADTAFNWFMPSSGVPSNWLTPADYYNGTWYVRYEVISVATTSPFGIRLGIIQNDTGKLYEQPIQQLQGTGDVVIHSSNPSGWVKTGGGVDFSKVSEIQNLCSIIYDWNTLLQVNPGESCWSNRYNWFPVTLRISIVAVSSGSTFTGWAGYLNIKKPTPVYSIDYINEITNKKIPSNDEYSYNASMSGAVSGNGQKLVLIPGQDVYFRTKASGDTLASEIQHLNVPLRPATPAISIDFTNEKTAQNISISTEYSTSLAFTSPVTGIGNKLTLIPGQNMYFRVKASISNFVSLVQSLIVPARTAAPSYTVDYLNEKTAENIGTGIEYTQNVLFTSPVTGTGTKVSLIPGQNMYFRNKATLSAFASDVFLLNVIARPLSPAFTINYNLEKTGQNITSNLEYSADNSFAVSTTGDGNSITVIPGQNLYFRYKATAISFSSELFLLVVAERPGIPTATINYPAETTMESFASTFQYSKSPSYTNPVTCTGTPISLTPGQDLYIWQKSTLSSFASLDYHLVVPIRPATGISFSIDYMNEKTIENVSSNIEFSVSDLFSLPISGTGNKVSLNPGQSLYFREKAKPYTFASETFLLVVNARPSTPIVNIDYSAELTSQKINSDVEYSTSANFVGSTTGSGNKISITPGQNLYFRVIATSGNFASESYLLNVPDRPAKPVATINFSTETTVESFPATVHYSKSPSYSNPVSGAGTPIPLTPGQDLYIWIKPTSSSFASLDYHLIVPDRLATSLLFNIDYAKGETMENVSSEIEYSTSNLFDVTITGTGNKVSLIPGQDLYFRVKATTGTFASSAFLLSVGARPKTPNVSINYFTEYTIQNITSDIEYATSNSFTGSFSGDGNKIAITPGQNLYFRVKPTSGNFASEIFFLNVPERPAKPTITINYSLETTVESFPQTYSYSKSPTYSNPVSCSGTPISLTPGQDLYMWIKPTSVSFASMDYHLVVPERPYLEYTGGRIVTAASFSVKAVLADNIAGFNLTDILVTNGHAENLKADKTFDVYPDQTGEVRVIIPSNSFGGASFGSNELKVYYDSTASAIQQNEISGFNIYPNPSYNGKIYIQTTTNVPYTIDVISSEGSNIKSIVAYENDCQQLDLQNLKKGIYFLKITSNNAISVHKVVLK
jgi:hypothetical protein